MTTPTYCEDDFEDHPKTGQGAPPSASGKNNGGLSSSSKPRKAGRPTKLTPALVARLCGLLEAGNYRGIAARAAGISGTTFYRWMERGQAEESGPYRDLVEAVEEAEARAEVKTLAIINRAAEDGNWQAAAWRLERKHPDRWSRQNRPVTNSPKDDPQQIAIQIRQLVQTIDASVPPPPEGSSEGK